MAGGLELVGSKSFMNFSKPLSSSSSLCSPTRARRKLKKLSSIEKKLDTETKEKKEASNPSKISIPKGKKKKTTWKTPNKMIRRNSRNEETMGIPLFFLQPENQLKSPKLSFLLSKEEIEDDFLAMTGSKPPKKPKKRSKVIQKELDVIFPGLGFQ